MWLEKGDGLLPHRHQVCHGIGVILKLRLLSCWNRRRILAAGKDVFLPPCRIDTRVLMLPRLGAVCLCAFRLRLWRLAVCLLHFAFGRHDHYR